LLIDAFHVDVLKPNTRLEVTAGVRVSVDTSNKEIVQKKSFAKEIVFLIIFLKTTSP